MYKTSLYRIDQSNLKKLKQAALGNRESDLQKWIWDDPDLLGEPIGLIAREVVAGSGRRIDILGIDQNEQICVIELKRDKTPREVVAQALDYASWVADESWHSLDQISIAETGYTISQIFINKFGTVPVLQDPPEPRMIIVASQLDEASERIARFLTDRGIAINALFFTTFQDGPQQLLASSWLIDLEDAQERTATAPRKQSNHPSSGYWFVNVGASKANPEDPMRSWSDNRKFGFMSAGGGVKYEKMLNNIPVGGKIFAWLNGAGYVGLGQLRSKAVPISEFRLEDGTQLTASNLEQSAILRTPSDASEEYAIGVDWISTFDADEGIKAAWHSVMTACALNKPDTLTVLKEAFQKD